MALKELITGAALWLAAINPSYSQPRGYEPKTADPAKLVRIVLDPGHDFSDRSSSFTYAECAANVSLAKYLKEALLRDGRFAVFQTYDEKGYHPVLEDFVVKHAAYIDKHGKSRGNRRYSQRLNARGMIGDPRVPDSINADLYLSIHHNSGAGMHGFEVYISSDANAGQVSAQLARLIHRNLREERHQPSSRGGNVLGHGFIPLLHRNFAGALVEVDYLNGANIHYLRSQQAQQPVVKALYESLCEKTNLSPIVDITKIQQPTLQIQTPSWSPNSVKRRKRHR